METFIFIYLLTLNSLLGGWFARMDGGAPPKTWEWVERSLSISFFIAAAAAAGAGWWSLAAFCGTLGLATGHGQYFLDRNIKAIYPERVDFIVRLFFGQDPRTLDTSPQDDYDLFKDRVELYGMTKLYWRNVFGMFCTGSLVGLFTAIIFLSYGHFLPALIISLTGAVKALSYMIGEAGRSLNFKTGIEHLEWGSEVSEFLNGFLRTTLAITALTLAL